MLTGNVMAKALVAAGLAEMPAEKRKRPGKRFTCKKCGKPMVNEDWTNVMWCPNCKASFFIFENRKSA